MDATIGEATARKDEDRDAHVLCRHWQPGGLCVQACACGHGCAEHHDAGWCSRCRCLRWSDEPHGEAAIGPPLAVIGPPLAVGDDWDLADVFDDDRVEPELGCSFDCAG